MFNKVEKTIDEAIQTLKLFQNEIKIIKQNELNKHYEIPILRNNNNDPIILIYNIKSEQIGEVIVPGDKWHDIMLYKWTKSKNNYRARINGKYVILTTYLLK